MDRLYLTDHLPEIIAQSQDFESSILNDTVIEDTKVFPISSSEPQQESGLPHSLMDRYTLDKPLSEGAFGLVWRGRDEKLDREVAIKFFHGGPDREKAAFAYETRFLSTLESPGVPAVYDLSNPQDEHSYIVMQLVNGMTLKELITRLKSGDEDLHQAFHFARRMELILQLLRILSRIHQSDLLHRDIKPENLIIDSTGALYLIDWGLATTREEIKGKKSTSGTPLYMSPEQFLGRDLDVRSDIYGVGAVAFELLALTHRVQNPESVIDLGIKVVEGNTLNLHFQKHPNQGWVPSEFALPITKALSVNPSDRYQSADEMRFEIQQILGGYFAVVCNRTRVKAKLYRYLRWLDQRPYHHYYMTICVLALSMFILLGLGVILGMYIQA